LALGSAAKARLVPIIAVPIERASVLIVFIGESPLDARRLVVAPLAKWTVRFKKYRPSLERL
jgi:hypothetical protein